jgi:asparagine synthase (glutamine-hydrolysing)
MNTLPLARELMDVNLTGWDGGTLMGHADSIEPLQITAVDDSAFLTRLFYLFNQRFTWPSITEAEENLLYCPPIRHQLQGMAFDSFKSEITPYLNYRNDIRGEYFYIDNHVRRLTQNFVVFTRSYVEVRIPFFDYDLFEFLYSLPSHIRADRMLHRAMIQREMPRLAYIPYDKDEIVPTTNPLIRGIQAETVKFKRRVNRHIAKIFPDRHSLYADYEEYLRTDLREWAERILYDKKTEERGIFNPSFLQSLMKRHLSRLEEWTIGKIAPLITYEMMLRRFYD